MASFDEFLETRIQCGLYQYKIFGSIAFLTFIEANYQSFLSIQLSILASEWDLSRSQITLLGVSFYLGNWIGHLCCALFADYLGRRNLLVIGSFLTFVLMLINNQIQETWQAALVRFQFGVVFGTIIPISSVLMSEIMPKGLRGRTQSLLQFMFICGKIYLIVTCFFFLEDYTKGNWRGLLLFISIPTFICFVLSIFTLNESARYLITSGQFTFGFNELIRMGRLNTDYSFQLSCKEVAIRINIYVFKKDSLVVYWVVQCKQNMEQKRLSDIFNEENKNTTIKLWALSFLFYLTVGMLFTLMPFLFQNQSKGFIALLQTYIFELVSVIFVFNLIDKQIVGRIKILTFCYCALCIISFIIYLYPEQFLVLGISLMKFFINIAIPTFVVLLNESYKTTHRTLGVGSALASGRFASTLSPMIGFALYFYNPYAPFPFLCFTYIITIAIVLTIPFDKTQKFLDIKEDKD